MTTDKSPTASQAVGWYVAGLLSLPEKESLYSDLMSTISPVEAGLVYSSGLDVGIIS